MSRWRSPFRPEVPPLGRERGRAVPVVPLPPAAARAVERARNLSAEEIDALDAAEAAGASTREVVWAVLRDQVDRAGLRAERMTARNAAWAAVRESGARAGIDVPEDDRAWRRVPGRGAGAARAARYAACALVGGELVDPEVAAFMIGPWAAVVGGPGPA